MKEGGKLDLHELDGVCRMQPRESSADEHVAVVLHSKHVPQIFAPVLSHPVNLLLFFDKNSSQLFPSIQNRVAHRTRSVA